MRTCAAPMPGSPTRDTVLELVVANPGISDREIAETLYGPGASGAAVNATCRQLADESVTKRRLREDGLMGNWVSSATSRD